jgi:uncharacterized RDD family membrane protein YckC
MKLSLKRLLAYWLDFVLLAFLLCSVQLILYKTSSGFPFVYLNKGYQIELWVLFSMSLPVWLYFIYFELRRQQTIGKRILNLKVMNMEGTRLNIQQVLVRTCMKLLPWELTHIIVLVPRPWWSMEIPNNQFLILIPNMIMILYIIVLFINKGERAIHDYAAKTKISG